jgi:HTH-type transcriptional regulator / antitoxin HigA
MLERSRLLLKLSRSDKTIIDTRPDFAQALSQMAEQLELPIFKDPEHEGTPLAPGLFIKRELEKRNWPQSALAEILGKPLAAVNEVIKGKRSLTPEMALVLGNAFGQQPALWLHREAAYRMSLISGTGDGDTARKAQLFECAPIKDLQRRGWINPNALTADELEAELTKFMGYNPTADNNKKISAFARKAFGHHEFSNSQRAWLLQAASMARKTSVRNYNKQQLAAALVSLRKLCKDPANGAKIPIILAEAGIRFVVVEDLPGTRIDGAAFFLDEDVSRPVVALSLRIDRMESVWHTLIHELRHIANEDPLSLDLDIVGKGREALISDMERRADEEAADWLVDKDQIKRFALRAKPWFTKDSIIPFAGRMGVHPSIVVGQLQHSGVIGWEKHSDFREKIRDHILVTAMCDGYGKQK